MASRTTSTSSSRPKPSSSSRRCRYAAALSLAGLSASAACAPVTYRLDPDQTFVTFEVRHFGTSTLRGRIGPVQGDVRIDRTAGTGDLRLRIPVGTVDTGVPALDARLREPDLLATREYPEAYYIATRFRFDGGQVAEVRGEFILRGTSEPLSLVARRFGCRRDERLQAEVCGGDFEGDLLRSRFGATFGEPFVADAVHLVVQVEGVAQN